MTLELGDVRLGVPPLPSCPSPPSRCKMALDFLSHGATQLERLQVIPRCANKCKGWGSEEAKEKPEILGWSEDGVAERAFIAPHRGGGGVKC